ncbi:RalA-binding protein [Acrasis kona]|uniref:RalA-binding protein n=1 Tax=Acrasis kona TaxID=1008807 RepID=A0AAW2YQ67_9EUKA
MKYPFKSNSKVDIDELYVQQHGATFPPIDVYEPVFGRSLSHVMSAESTFYSDGAKIPTILRQCVESLYRSTWKFGLGLYTDGIFRESGNNLKIQLYKELCDKRQLTTISLNNSIDNPFTISNAHNVASLLKQYLRELPEPIMGFGAYDPVVNYFEELHRSAFEHYCHKSD